MCQKLQTILTRAVRTFSLLVKRSRSQGSTKNKKNFQRNERKQRQRKLQSRRVFEIDARKRENEKKIRERFRSNEPRSLWRSAEWILFFMLAFLLWLCAWFTWFSSIYVQWTKRFYFKQIHDLFKMQQPI